MSAKKSSDVSKKNDVVSRRRLARFRHPIKLSLGQPEEYRLIISWTCLPIALLARSLKEEQGCPRVQRVEIHKDKIEKIRIKGNSTVRIKSISKGSF